MSTLPQLNPASAQDAARFRRGLLVAGSGSIGRRHLANLRRLGEAEATLYRTGHRDAAAPPIEAPEECDLARALAKGPRAVLVCNPSALHLDVALAAVRSGAHVFIEKPLSHTLDGVSDLEQEVERRGLVGLVGFQYRFHPSLRRVKEWLDSGLIGRLVSARVHWGEEISGWHPGEDWRCSYAARRDLGGGALRTLCHPFDYLRWLLGEVDWVSAVVSNEALGLDVEDLAHVILHFDSGPLATVTLDYFQQPRSHGLEIQGTEGRITWSDGSGAATLFDPRQRRSFLFTPDGDFSRNTMFLDEMRHLLRCLDGGESPQCTLSDGRRALEITLAAQRSSEEGRRIIVGGRS